MYVLSMVSGQGPRAIHDNMNTSLLFHVVGIVNEFVACEILRGRGQCMIQ